MLALSSLLHLVVMLLGVEGVIVVLDADGGHVVSLRGVSDHSDVGHVTLAI